MTLTHMKPDPSFTEHLVSKGAFESEPFSLIDVGASGGLEAHWQAFGRSLSAVGFEPLVAETRRLNESSANPGVSFRAALVEGGEDFARDVKDLPADRIAARDNQPFYRTSAARAVDLMRMDYVQNAYDPSGKGEAARERVTLDEAFPDGNVDFIKVDTDGHDYEVLRGAQRLIDRSRVLGAFVECQFHGPVHEHANLFSNIDRFLRGKGLTLFDIDVYRYSRAALPKPFMIPLPAQTDGGQALWGDALYLRDAGDPGYDAMWPGPPLTPVKLLKLAALFELYGLEDCAAELLLARRRPLSALIDVDRCLDLLTPPFRGRRLSYAQYVALFERQTRLWWPGSQAPFPRARRGLRGLVDKARARWSRVKARLKGR